MSKLQIFKPNASNTGCAATFSISNKYKDKEPLFFLNGIFQHSWDAERRIGSFAGNFNDPSKKISVKFSEFELAEIINTINTKQTFSNYHRSANANTSFIFARYPAKRGKEPNVIEVDNFGFSITQNTTVKMKIGLTPGEALRLKYFIEGYFRTLDAHRASVSFAKTETVNEPAEEQEEAIADEGAGF